METIQSQHNPFPWHGWFGIIIMASAEILLFNGNKFVATWMTPIMWSGYILTTDAILYRSRGKSWLKTRLREFPFLILISVGTWILFEVYNFHLKNWQYVGTPSNMVLRDLGFFWSFATIMPGVFLTAEVLNALLASARHQKETRYDAPRFSSHDWVWFVLGLLMVSFPLFVEEKVAAYLFAFIWLGFIPLLYPINKRLSVAPFANHWTYTNQRFIFVLLAAGFICGLLWEAWNYQAYNADGAFWVYTIPQPLRIFGYHYGKMPLLGLLGFPPFALELHAFYQFFRKCLGGDRSFGSQAGMLT